MGGFPHYNGFLFTPARAWCGESRSRGSAPCSGHTSGGQTWPVPPGTLPGSSTILHPWGEHQVASEPHASAKRSPRWPPLGAMGPAAREPLLDRGAEGNTWSEDDDACLVAREISSGVFDWTSKALFEAEVPDMRRRLEATAGIFGCIWTLARRKILVPA